LYVGNGQYYDPATGRFLTRDVNPDSTNPYVPWNPIGAILGPLGLIVLVFGRRKKGSKVGTFLVLLLVVGSMGMTLAACSGQQTPTGEYTAVVTPTGATITFPDGTVVNVTPSPGGLLGPLAIPCPTPSLSPTGIATPTPAVSSVAQYLRDTYGVDQLVTKRNLTGIGKNFLTILSFRISIRFKIIDFQNVFP
jgi:hypothetical protein